MCQLMRFWYLSHMCKAFILSHLVYIVNAKNVLYPTTMSQFESPRKAHTSLSQLPLQNDISHGVRQCYIISILERPYKYM